MLITSYLFTAQNDFMNLNTSLVFSPGQISGCLSIDIIDDRALESNETLSLLLSSNDSRVLVNNSITSIVIVDNDGKFSLV